jgi:hypothetical protein
MSLLYKLLLIWYNGVGEVLVFATCPLIVGSLLVVLLHLLQGWHRPARLWVRIRLLRPIRWIIVIFACSLISFAYLWSLKILRNTAVLSQMLHPNSDWREVHLILLSWLFVAGGVVTICNVIPVLFIPIDALRSKGLWLTLRCEWTEEAQKGWEKTFAGKVWIYYDGTYETVYKDKTEHRFFLLERNRDGSWKIIVQQSAPGKTCCITIRRPSVKRLESIHSGEWRTIQEGDILTFAGNERWYILVKKLYP